MFSSFGVKNMKNVEWHTDFVVTTNQPCPLYATFRLMTITIRSMDNINTNSNNNNKYLPSSVIFDLISHVSIRFSICCLISADGSLSKSRRFDVSNKEIVSDVFTGSICIGAKSSFSSGCSDEIISGWGAEKESYCSY